MFLIFELKQMRSGRCYLFKVFQFSLLEAYFQRLFLILMLLFLILFLRAQHILYHVSPNEVCDHRVATTTLSCFLS